MTRMSLAMSVAALFICTSHLSSDACTRVVYAGTNGNVATGRTLDWRTPIPTSLRRHGKKLPRESDISYPCRSYLDVERG